MAFLAPLAAGAVGKTAGAAALAKAAGGASSLASGITAGAALGKGAMATMPALSYAGTNLAAPGILGALPSAVAPTAGIFAKAAPALGGLKAGTTIPGLASAAPGATGFKSLAMANAPLTANPASWNAVNQFAGLGSQTGNLAPEMVKASQTVSSQLANQVPQQTPGLVENIRSVNTALRGPVEMSYAPNAQGLSQNAAALQQAAASTVDPSKGFLSNAVSLAKNPSMQGAMDYIETHPVASAGAAYGLYNLLKPKPKQPQKDVSLIRPYDFSRTQNPEAYAVSPTDDSSERQYFTETFTPLEPYEAPGPEYKRAAEGGIMGLAVGGPVETMSAMNAIGGNMQYPQAGLQTALYSNPMVQRPEAVNVISPGEGPAVGAYSGEPKFAKGGVSALGLASYAGDRDAVRTNQNTHSQNINSGSSEKLKATKRAAKSGDFAAYKALQNAGYDMHAPANYAGGGLSDLGGYSDGGRLLKGPGDGVSDSIPAVIGERQPARLADGEFVVPARIVSELGNGSTEAGARKLYAMMDRVQRARRKTVGKNRVATNTRAEKHLPA
jgi:hypothetical protein